MTDEIPVCPECDSARLYSRTGRHNNRRGWYCVECRELKQRAAYRRPKTIGGLTPSGLPNKLLQMDPDDI